MRFLRVLVASVAVAALGVAGGGAAGASDRSAAKPQSGGTLNALASSQNWTTMDPVGLRGTPFYEYTTFAVYDALFYEEPGSLKITPRMAQSFTTSDAGKTWLLKLRPEIKFSDGTPLD